MRSAFLFPCVFFWLAPFPDAPPDPTRHTMRSTLFLRSPCLVVGHQWYDQCCQKWVACWKSRGLCKHQKNSHDNGKPTICICISYSFLFAIFQHCDFPETATLVNHRGRDERVRRRPWWYPKIIWGASLDGASYAFSIPLPKRYRVYFSWEGPQTHQTQELVGSQREK